MYVVSIDWVVLIIYRRKIYEWPDIVDYSVFFIDFAFKYKDPTRTSLLFLIYYVQSLAESSGVKPQNSFPKDSILSQLFFFF